MLFLSQQLTAFRLDETMRLCTTYKFNADKIDVDMSLNLQINKTEDPYNSNNFL